jgi:isochorismate hydrolase
MEANIVMQNAPGIKDLLSVHRKFSFVKRTDIAQEVQGDQSCQYHMVTVYYFLGIPIYRKARFFTTIS